MEVEGAWHEYIRRLVGEFDQKLGLRLEVCSNHLGVPDYIGCFVFEVFVAYSLKKHVSARFHHLRRLA